MEYNSTIISLIIIGGIIIFILLAICIIYFILGYFNSMDSIPILPCIVNSNSVYDVDGLCLSKLTHFEKTFEDEVLYIKSNLIEVTEGNNNSGNSENNKNNKNSKNSEDNKHIEFIISKNK